MKFLTVVTCLVAIFAQLGKAQYLIDSIVDSFSQRSPVYCVTIWAQNPRAMVIKHTSILPVYLVDASNLELLKGTSKICKSHIFFLDQLAKISSLNLNSLTLGTSKFALILEEKASVSVVKQLLDVEQGPLKKITELAIFVPKNEVNSHYSVFARNPSNEYEVLLMNQWADGGYLHEKPIFPTNRYTQYNGLSLKTTSFNYEPFVMRGPSGEYTGFEIQLLDDMAKALNFSYKIQNPTDGNLWGEIMNNGTATGLVRDIKDGVADIGMADLYIIPERRKFIDYLSPHFNDYLCFLVAQPPLNPKWKDLAIPFQPETWLAALGTFFFSLICIVMYGFFYPYSELSAGKGFIYLFAILFDNSYVTTRKIENPGIKLALALFMFMIYTTTISYRGSLNSVLTVKFFPKPINTLVELSNQNIAVGSFSTVFKNTLEESVDPIIQKIVTNYITHYDFDGAFRNASANKLVMAESQQFLQFNLRRRFTNKYGETSMHIMRECYNSFRVAFTVPINSIYKSSLDRTIVKIFESGLPGKYFNDILDSEGRQAKSLSSQTGASSLGLYHLQGPFMLLPMLLSCCIIIFGIEYALGHSTFQAIQKQPLFTIKK